MAVARHTREHSVACARGARDRSGPSVGLACFGIAVVSGIITKLGQRSGTEDRSQAGQADLCVQHADNVLIASGLSGVARASCTEAKTLEVAAIAGLGFRPTQCYSLAPETATRPCQFV
jgi:hypothetical protein